MISLHAIPPHLHAADSQLYVSFISNDSASAMYGLQLCFATVQSWMLMNMLKLNANETECLLAENERQQSKYLFKFPVELFGVICS